MLMHPSKPGKGGRPDAGPSPLLQRLVWEFRVRISRYRKDIDGFLQVADEICFDDASMSDIRERLYWYHYFRTKCRLSDDRRRSRGVIYRRW